MGCLGLSFLGGDMTHDEFRSWALKQLEEHMRRNLPSVKLARQLKASQRESKKAMAHARRSLASSLASSKRKLDLRLSDLEREFRERREASDREFEQRRWDLVTGSL